MFTSRSYGARPETSSPSSSTLPEVGASNPAIIRRQVVLPGPGGPEHREELALADVEVDAVDGDHVAEPLDDRLEA